MATRNIKAACLLNDGVQIPYLGLGVYASSTCTKACLTSFDEGYRHIDTAQLYGNEAEVGVSDPSSSLKYTAMLTQYCHLTASRQCLLYSTVLPLRHL